MASDARGLRDLTLWETNDGGAVNFHTVRQARPCRGVPAVLGITVAEIEESKAECREALERMERAVRDRDEARAERDQARAEAKQDVVRCEWCRERILLRRDESDVFDVEPLLGAEVDDARPGRSRHFRGGLIEDDHVYAALMRERDEARAEAARLKSTLVSDLARLRGLLHEIDAVLDRSGISRVDDAGHEDGRVARLERALAATDPVDGAATVSEANDLALALAAASERADRYQEALERITAAHIAGASAGELADRARATLGARRVASGGGA